MIEGNLAELNPASIWARKYRAGTEPEQRHVLEQVTKTEQWGKNARGDVILRGPDGRIFVEKTEDVDVVLVWWLPYGGCSLKFPIQKRHLVRFANLDTLHPDRRVRFESIFMEV